MKKIIISVLTIILIIAFIAVGVLSYKLVKTQKLYNDNKPLYCIYDGIKTTGKYEFYFHFKDGILNSYTMVNTRTPFSETGYANLKKTLDDFNTKQKYNTSKIVQDSEKVVITENYNYEGYTIEELLDQSAYFIKDKKEIATRSQILDIFEEVKNNKLLDDPEQDWNNLYVSCE